MHHVPRESSSVQVDNGRFRSTATVVMGDEYLCIRGVSYVYEQDEY
jgi:hypothetical protein